ncbi:MAG TPA: 16S rRNA (guanine(527)-N(7))-methyltransferase RsmG [Desulfobacterales bacterium]
MEVGSPEWKEVIRSGALQLGISLEAAVLDRFALHAAELLRWNRRMNLTAVTDPLAVAVKHYIDSIAPAEHVPCQGRLLDLGSGGGFPGIPLQILMPTLHVTLVEASRKKASFLKHVARCLALKQLKILEMRAEEVSTAEIGYGFDLIVCRALTSLERFFAMALPLAASGTRLMAWKGKLPGDELNRGIGYLQTAAKLTSKDVSVQKFTLPVFAETRNLVIVTLP